MAVSKFIPRANLELLIRRERQRQAKDDRLFVSRAGAGEMLDCRYQYVRKLCESGELIMADEGASPYRILVPAIYDFKVRRLIALGDPNDPPDDALDALLPHPPASNDVEAQSAIRALVDQARQATEALAGAQQAFVATQRAFVAAQRTFADAQQAMADAQQALVAVLPRAPTKREKEKAALIALKELGISN